MPTLVLQKVNNFLLPDLIPKIRMSGYLNEVAGVSVDGNIQNNSTHKSLWHSVWIAWHYTVMTLTHQDALLTTGIVEYGIPTALSSKRPPSQYIISLIREQHAGSWESHVQNTRETYMLTEMSYESYVNSSPTLSRTSNNRALGRQFRTDNRANE